MILISILIALGIARLTGDRYDRQAMLGFDAYRYRLQRRFCTKKFWNGPLGIVVTLAGPLLVVGLLQFWFYEWLWGIPGFLLGVAVLLLALSATNLDALADAYIDACEEEDEERAARVAAEIRPEGEAVSTAPRGQDIVDILLVQALRWFGVLFWYAVLGPLGAVLFRLSAHLRMHSDEVATLDPSTTGYSEAARRLYAILSWIPARLMAIGYALSGHFDGAMQGWRASQEATSMPMDADAALLISAGEGALHGEAPVFTRTASSASLPGAAVAVRAAVALIERTLKVWLVIIALMTFAHWAS